jgi:hypothetical protein
MNFDGKSTECEKVRLYCFVQNVRVFCPKCLFSLDQCKKKEGMRIISASLLFQFSVRQSINNVYSGNIFPIAYNG